jgi:hypothetical protein
LNLRNTGRIGVLTGRGLSGGGGVNSGTDTTVRWSGGHFVAVGGEGLPFGALGRMELERGAQIVFRGGMKGGNNGGLNSGTRCHCEEEREGVHRARGG